MMSAEVLQAFVNTPCCANTLDLLAARHIPESIDRVLEAAANSDDFEFWLQELDTHFKCYYLNAIALVKYRQTLQTVTE